MELKVKLDLLKKNKHINIEYYVTQVCYMSVLLPCVLG
jgi:hypothetical protein